MNPGNLKLKTEFVAIKILFIPYIFFQKKFRIPNYQIIYKVKANKLFMSYIKIYTNQKFLYYVTEYLGCTDNGNLNQPVFLLLTKTLSLHLY